MKDNRFAPRHVRVMEGAGFWVSPTRKMAELHMDLGRKGTWLGKVTLSPDGKFFHGELYPIGRRAYFLEATVPTTCSDRQLAALCALLTKDESQ